MAYLQFQVAVPPDKTTFFEEFLGDAIESMWWGDEGHFTGIIAADNRPLFERLCSQFFDEIGKGPADIAYSEIGPTDWLQEDQLRLSPIEVGRFFIYPPHYAGDVPGGKVCFKIDSPKAFGSGHHETTKMCLEGLEDLAKKITVSCGLDIGCGSGILALGMAHLWEAEVVAVDCDPASVESAKQNLEGNGISSVFVFECFGVNLPQVKERAPYDLIVANIQSGVLVELASDVSKLLGAQGYILLSGILGHQVEEVEEAYLAYGLESVKRIADGEWRAVVLRGKG